MNPLIEFGSVTNSTRTITNSTNLTPFPSVTIPPETIQTVPTPDWTIPILIVVVLVIALIVIAVARRKKA